MVVDPAVSRRKFDKEVAAARAHRPFWGQGVWILRAEYPLVFVVLMVNKPLPVLPAVVCGIHVDFTDYDVRPPSLRLVNPFDETPLDFNQSWKFPRANVRQDPKTQNAVAELQNLLQVFDNARPFFCIPGVREYHECSAHTGDSWFLHRKPNMLIHLLSILREYVPGGVQFLINPALEPRVGS